MGREAREITTLLGQLGKDAEAEAALFRLVETRFHRIARKLLRGANGDSLQSTMLVHDAFRKLLANHEKNGYEKNWRDREEFFGLAARAMRQIKVDYARRKNAEKRGGGEADVSLDAVASPIDRSARDPQLVVAIDEVVDRLRQFHPEAFQVFDLYFFAEWTLREIADDIMELSLSTVKRRWNLARAFLRQELEG